MGMFLAVIFSQIISFDELEGVTLSVTDTPDRLAGILRLEFEPCLVGGIGHLPDPLVIAPPKMDEFAIVPDLGHVTPSVLLQAPDVHLNRRVTQDVRQLDSLGLSLQPNWEPTDVSIVVHELLSELPSDVPSTHLTLPLY